ncbi:MAG: hypothetical protein JO189_00745 [Deltaproteobacteria bacterium]|nr:hypothetical protein [Deltaproteobacteria bacterium]
MIGRARRITVESIKAYIARQVAAEAAEQTLASPPRRPPESHPVRRRYRRKRISASSPAEAMPPLAARGDD